MADSQSWPAPHQPSQVLTDVRFWAQVIGDMKRVIVCSPELEDQVRQAVSDNAVEHLVEVRPNPHCPKGRVLVIDQQAIEADFAGTPKLRFEEPFACTCEKAALHLRDPYCPVHFRH